MVHLISAQNDRETEMTETLKQMKSEHRMTKRGDDPQRQIPERPVVTQTILSNITQRIVEVCDPDEVILFGSYAYGTPHQDSDIDLFVVMKPKDAQETNHQRIMNVRAAAKIYFLPMDVIVRTPQEIETRLAMGDFFIQEILNHGKVLYQRDAA